MVVLDVDHPDVEEFIWWEPTRRRRRGSSESAGYDMSLELARLGLDPVPEREQLDPRQRRLHGGRRGEDWNLDRPHRRQRSPDPACARAPAPGRRGRVAPPTRASSTTRRSTRGTRSRTRGGSTRPTRARSMSIDDGACNLASINLMIPPRGRRPRRRGLRARSTPSSWRRRSSSAARATRRPRSGRTPRRTGSSASATRTSARS